MPKTKDAERTALKKEFKRIFMAARIEANVSQVALAKKTGISNSTISNYEVGKTYPDEKNMAKLIKVLPRLAEHLKLAKGAAAPKAESRKSSLIEEARVLPDQARVSFMKSLVAASQGLKDLAVQAERAGIPKQEAQAMLKELGVSLNNS